MGLKQLFTEGETKIDVADYRENMEEAMQLFVDDNGGTKLSKQKLEKLLVSEVKGLVTSIFDSASNS